MVTPGSVVRSAASGPRIIDTHHHIFPPHFTSQNLTRIVSEEPAVRALYTNWTPRYSLDQMNQNGVATAVGSITSPGVWFGNTEEGRKLARECTEYGAQLKRDYPGRFGMFAAIPLPDTEGSLREIEYALDVLKLDGIRLLTSCDKGKLLGDLAFASGMDEPNRRRAVVFVHPTMTCCGNPIPGLNKPSLEYPFDTARTITSLIFSGTCARCPDIPFIFSHGGGSILMVISRISGGGLKPEERAKILPSGIDAEVRRHYYDIASVAVNQAAMAAVFKEIPTSHIVFGSDLPFWTIEKIATAIKTFALPMADMRAVQCDNALQLLPSLRN
jgi:predicted TIM-barrel fold metal-dependent hydrolase